MPAKFIATLIFLQRTCLPECLGAEGHSLWLGEVKRSFPACIDFLAFMEWADDIGSRPAAWGYVPVRSSSCSLRVFYKTLAVGKESKDTY